MIRGPEPIGTLHAATNRARMTGANAQPCAGHQCGAEVIIVVEIAAAFEVDGIRKPGPAYHIQIDRQRDVLGKTALLQCAHQGLAAIESGFFGVTGNKQQVIVTGRLFDSSGYGQQGRHARGVVVGSRIKARAAIAQVIIVGNQQAPLSGRLGSRQPAQQVDAPSVGKAIDIVE